MNSLVNRWMRRKQARESGRTQRIYDKQMRRRRARFERHPLVRGLELAQRTREIERVVREFRAASIGLVFARARDRQLDKRRRDRREDPADYQPLESAFVVVAAPDSEHRTPSNHR